MRFVRCLRGVTAREIGNAPARIAVQTRYFERTHASGTAEVRARDLLLRMLSPSQRKEFEFGYFSVNAYTGNHAQTIAEFALAVGEELGLPAAMRLVS